MARLTRIHAATPHLADRGGGTLINVSGTHFRDCAPNGSQPAKLETHSLTHSLTHVASY